MKLFFYYAFHSVKNQIKKLFKTWVFIMIAACFLLGIVIGVVGSSIEDMASDREEDHIEEEYIEDGSELEDVEYAEDEYEQPSEPIIQNPVLQLIIGDAEINRLEITELVLGLLVFGLIILLSFGADKNGSKIFLPADVNLLFPAPLKPQSVLMFRLMTQIGTLLILSVIYVCYIPIIKDGLGISVGGSIGFIFSWFLALIFGTLLQMTFYLLTATYQSFRKIYRTLLYVVCIAAAGALAAVVYIDKCSIYEGAVKLFCSKASRFIPIWGWIKGFGMFAAEGNAVGTLCSLAAVIASMVLLIFFVWQIDADFYEDAMAKSEQTAALLEAAQSGNNIVNKRTKDRSESLNRDGMKYGSGANVFFFKTMYNRFRFAKFGIFTKTLITYIVFAVGVGIITRFAGHSDSTVYVALTLAAMTFYRTLGNPLEEDTKSSFFTLIPESTWKKLFWSLMGGCADCFLNVLPAMLIGTIICGGNLLVALAWIPFIVSIDFFATTVGVFIGLSVPENAGKNMKQVVQILFIYFGLLPDIIIIALGFVLEAIPAAVLIASLLNIIIGLIFFGIAPVFVDPYGGKAVKRDVKFEGDISKVRRSFSIIGLSMFVFMVITEGLRTVIVLLLDRFAQGWSDNIVVYCVSMFAPMYLIALPICLLIMRAVGRDKPVQTEKSSLRIRDMLILFTISQFFVYVCNIIGSALSALLGSLVQNPAGNPVVDLAIDYPLWLKIVLMVIIGPAIEEFVFRKSIIDRTKKYGEKTAIIFSAVIFGLFHGNLTQLFYAFTLGLVFGYIYTKTGKLRYSMILHMVINFFGSVVSLELYKRSGLEDFADSYIAGGEVTLQAGTIAFLVYVLLLIAVCLFGLVMLCIKARDVRFAPAESELPAKKVFSTAYVNIGFILFAAAAIAECVIYVLEG